MRIFRQLQRTILIARNQTFPKNIVLTDIPKTNNDASIKRSGFTPGEQAPFAYHDTYQYPEDYKPWGFNYKGDGILLGALGLFTYAYLAYEESYLNRTGRKERPQREYFRP